MYEYIVFSGGASKGLAYVGVLKYFEEHPDLIKNVNEYVGCSIGAFSALLIILGYNSETLINIFNKYNFDSLKKLKVSKFFTYYGLDSGDKLETFIKVFIKKKLDSDLITLQELYDLTKKKLITVVTNVNTKKTEYISKDTYPDLPVYLAVQMSMNIPLLFKPIEFNNYLYVDGALTCNFPVNYYTDKKHLQVDFDKILAFVFHSENDNDNIIKNFEDYIFNIIKCSFSTIQNMNIYKAKTNNCHIVEIDHCIKNNLNFELSLDMKNKLYETGYNSIKKFIESITKDK